LVNFGPLKTVINAHVDLPQVDIGRSANAFEFGPRDFATRGISLYESPNRTYGAGRTHAGYCQKFLLFLVYRY